MPVQSMTEILGKALEQLADEVRRPRGTRKRNVEQPIRAVAFWRKVTCGAADVCWPWTGYKRSSGHGLTTYKSLSMHASRKAYILTHGFISSALCVNHRCDNAACCNPSHLYLGTRADNMIDFWSKTPAGERKQRGRPTTLDAKQLERLWQMRRRGKTLKDCAAVFDVHVATVCRYITIVRKCKLKKMQADRLRSSQ
jgi:hypothetical protein